MGITISRLIPDWDLGNKNPGNWKPGVLLPGVSRLSRPEFDFDWSCLARRQYIRQGSLQKVLASMAPEREEGG